MKSPFGSRGASSPDLGERLDALSRVVELCEARVEEKTRARASAVVNRAGARLSFSGASTVVALAGATGSGKSSLFNALAGAELAEPGVRRPTTSRAMAASFGDAGNDRLLDWLEIPVRTHVAHADELDGLVLLDLPDHDSIQLGHRLEAERLVGLVDTLVWVVDPQKYADAALHQRYLAPMARYAEVMMVVLNQSDRLASADLDHALADLRQLLDREGLGATPLLATSATTGMGVAELRARLARVVADKQAAARRTLTDVDEAVSALDEQLGPSGAVKVDGHRVDDLVRAFARAGGVDLVGEAVLNSTRRRGSAATGWPLVSWLSKLRADPLKRLHLDLPSVGRSGRPRPEEIEPTSVPRTSIARVGGGVELAQVATAVRALSDNASRGLPPMWADAVRTASLSHLSTLPDDLDRAVSATPLGMSAGRGWWRLVRALQWILLAALVAGCAWLAVNALFAGTLPVPRWHGAPVPTLLVLGGGVAGVLLGALSRLAVELSARRRRSRVLAALDTAIRQVAWTSVVAPVTEELNRREQTRLALATAAGWR